MNNFFWNINNLCISNIIFIVYEYYFVKSFTQSKKKQKKVDELCVDNMFPRRGRRGVGFSGLSLTKFGCLSHFTIYQTDTYPILVSIYICISIYIKYVTKITHWKFIQFSAFSRPAFTFVLEYSIPCPFVSFFV